MSFKQFFHYLSYIQYPLMIIALFFACKPFFYGTEHTPEWLDVYFKSMNSMLVFMGLGVSFSTLQDTTKTQNKLSRKVWEHPVKGKVALVILLLMTLGLIAMGLAGFFGLEDTRLKDLSLGTLMMGLGLIGLLKAAMEMFENHRMDRKPPLATSN